MTEPTEPTEPTGPTGPTGGREPAAAGPPAGPASAPAADPLRHSRTSSLWVAVVGLVVLLTLMAVFVLQNTRSVEVAFLGWRGEAPLAAALLIAVAAGLMLAVAAGSLRILQLRRRVRREQRR